VASALEAHITSPGQRPARFPAARRRADPGIPDHPITIAAAPLLHLSPLAERRKAECFAFISPIVVGL